MLRSESCGDTRMPTPISMNVGERQQQRCHPFVETVGIETLPEQVSTFQGSVEESGFEGLGEPGLDLGGGLLAGDWLIVVSPRTSCNQISYLIDGANSFFGR